MHTKRWSAAAAGCVLLVVSACGSQNGLGPSTTGDPAVATAPGRATGAGTSTVAGAGVAFDWATAGSSEEDARFWASMANPSALESEDYRALEDMASSATVVVLGRVLSFGPTRSIGEDGKARPLGVQDRTVLTYYGARVQVIDVLRGRLDPASGTTEITVEGLSGTTGNVPKGAAILFLRHKLDVPAGKTIQGPVPDGEADKYRLVNSQGVFVGINGLARNPISDALHPQADGRAIAPGVDNSDEPRDPVADQAREMTIVDLERLVRR